MVLAVLFAAIAGQTFFQTVEVEFADESAAARATLVSRALPHGKRYAFSTRWDDANMRHDRMSRTLSALGVRSTFYVNGKPTPAFSGVMSNVLSRGSSIGSHTMTHSYMSRLSPMRQFREVMESRIVLETASQSAVTTFVLPYSSIGTRADPECAVLAGRSLRNAGFLGGAERNPRQFATYGLSPGEWVSSDTFSIDDRNPDAAQFAARYAAAKRRIDAGNCPSGPHLTLGVHAWQSDEGMDRLADIVRPEAGRADTWYCNENEYVAYRVQHLAAKIERLSVDGRRVTWRLERPEPFAIGAAVPLACEFSEEPVKVIVDGHAVAAGRGLSVAVPAAHAMPVRYESGRGGVSVEGNVVRAEFVNETGEVLGDVVMTLRLPPCCEPGVLSRAVGRLKPGAKTVQTWKVGSGSEALRGAGEFFCAVQTDAVGKEGRIRFWQSFSRNGAQAGLENCARDCCRVAGPFQLAPIDELASAADGRWEKAKSEASAAPYYVSAMCNFKPMKGGIFLFLLEFEADLALHGDKWAIRADVPLLFAKCIFQLNGAVADVSAPVTLRDRANRLVVAVPADPGNWGGRLMISIVSAKDGAGVKYRKAE